MKAADIMTRNPVSVTPQESIAEAARLMLQHRISGLPVTDDDGAVVGVVTEGDLLRRAETGTERHRVRWLEFLLGPGRLAADYVDAHARKVGEVMTGDPAVAAPHDDLADIVTTMEKRHVKRVPVVEGRKLVGIVSRADLVRALVHNLAQEKLALAGKPTSDDEIRDGILAIVENERWGPRFSINVAVNHGVVDLHGTVTDDRARVALIVAAETVPGVKAVHDHLVWVEPSSGLVVGGDETR
ncbi:MAG TPA: CBS domain-containing protein [Stellaceae bacterium]|nr:CBS domain-containing protein [Stellaceae bacterium]